MTVNYIEGCILGACCNLVVRHRRKIPKTQWGDNLIHLERFLTAHGRFPHKPYSAFHDTLFHIKAGRESLDPMRRLVSDKEHVKRYIAATVGEERNVPTFAVLRSRKEANDYQYPHRCVIKPTHASGELLLRKEGEGLDKRRITSWFDLDYYEMTRERNYKGLLPKVIVEPFAFDREAPDDFRFFCVNGVPKMIFYDQNDNTIERFRSVLDTNWEQLPFSLKCQQRSPPPRPCCLDGMLEAAARLAAPFSFIRVDFYTDGNRFHVGELTNCHAAAMQTFVPRDSELRADEFLFEE
jgi:TupA-like ATPgrasp